MTPRSAASCGEWIRALGNGVEITIVSSVLQALPLVEYQTQGVLGTKEGDSVDVEGEGWEKASADRLEGIRQMVRG